MNQLPGHKNLPIHLLAACFKNTSATYKFYWFLSLVQAVEDNKTIIAKRELFSRMISNAWYTVNYFHISFGGQDKLQRAIKNLREYEGLAINADRELVHNTLMQSEKRETIQELNYFNSQVPHWFLSPWFPGKSRRDIYHLSKDSQYLSPYQLEDDLVLMHLLWTNYFKENAAVSKGFCYWNLARYLQEKNPSVPDIPNKLIKQAVRSNLNRQRNHYWNIVFSELESIECIYSKKVLSKDHYAVEHFVPYSFVSHDLIWNLIPADRSANSMKSDRLPLLEKYFDPFYQIQKRALQIVKKKQPENKFLQEYLTLFPELSDLDHIDECFTKEKFRDTIQPLVAIASNNGFEFMK